MRMRGKMVREKLIFVREKSVKSQGISFQTKSGHPAVDIFKFCCSAVKFFFVISFLLCPFLKILLQ